MKRRIYIHIGAHKTATTALQKFCWEQRKVLAENDIFYPDSNIYHFGHHRLAFALKKLRDPKKGDIPDFKEEIRALRCAIDESCQSNILISSEAFFVSNRNSLKMLRDELFDLEVNIIAVVRRQDNYLLSLYNQNARMVGNNFTQPLRAYIENPRSIAKEISFLQWLRLWRQVFGVHAVRLLRYEDCNPLSAVLDIVGLPEGVKKSLAIENSSVPAAVIETMRLSKKVGLSVSKQRTLRSFAIRIFSGWPKRRLTDLQRKHILDEFRKENDELFTDFGMNNTYE